MIDGDGAGDRERGPRTKRGDAGREGTTAQRGYDGWREQPRWGHRMPGAREVTLEDQPGEALAAGLLLSTAGDLMTKYEVSQRILDRVRQPFPA